MRKIEIFLYKCKQHNVLKGDSKNLRENNYVQFVRDISSYGKNVEHFSTALFMLILFLVKNCHETLQKQRRDQKVKSIYNINLFVLATPSLSKL